MADGSAMAAAGPPPNAEIARAEIAQIEAWFQEFNMRQQQASTFLARAAYLNGWLAAQPEPQPEPTADDPVT